MEEREREREVEMGSQRRVELEPALHGQSDSLPDHSLQLSFNPVSKITPT